MRSILLLISLSFLCASPAFLPAQPAVSLPDPQHVLDFLVGNMVSLQVLSSVPHGFPCVTSLTTLKNNTLQAIALFKEGHIVEAVELAEQTINGTFTNCMAANSEGLALFKNFLDIVRDPNFLKTALDRALENAPVLIEDFATGLEKLNNGSYFDAGVYFGKIPHLILSGPDARLLFLAMFGDNGTIPLYDFGKGFLEALKVNEAAPDNFKCVDDIMALKTLFPQVLELLKQLKVLEALQLLESTVVGDFDTCKSGLAQTATLFQEFLANIKQPGFLQIALGRAKDNFFTLLGDLTHGVESMKAQDFYNAGKSFGHIPHVILSGQL